MINTFVFTFAGSILPGQYLLGSPRWSKDMGLINVRLVCTAGNSTTPTVFQLEFNGVSAKTITAIPAFPGASINLVIPINLILSAGAELRIKCLSGPSDSAGALRAVGLNLSADDSTTITQPANDMWVQWVDGSNRFRMFDYDQPTHLFSESVAGISSGLATIDNASTFIATILGSTVARADSFQKFISNEFLCTGGLATTKSPRLEFYIGTARVATLTSEGQFLVLDVVESSGVSIALNRFCFYGAGVLAATIGQADSGSTILTAVELGEPT